MRPYTWGTGVEAQGLDNHIRYWKSMDVIIINKTTLCVAVIFPRPCKTNQSLALPSKICTVMTSNEATDLK